MARLLTAWPLENETYAKSIDWFKKMYRTRWWGTLDLLHQKNHVIVAFVQSLLMNIGTLLMRRGGECKWTQSLGAVSNHTCSSSGINFRNAKQKLWRIGMQRPRRPGDIKLTERGISTHLYIFLSKARALGMGSRSKAGLNLGALAGVFPLRRDLWSHSLASLPISFARCQ